MDYANELRTAPFSIVSNSTPYRSYFWVLGIINSCENNFQIDACRNLIDFFNAKYNHSDLTEELGHVLQERIKILS